ncbi:response regulator transcription factor [Persicitalea jodogahamensis]|uniref:DNA-binding response regulator n=1 Tax=Persicitalea jodogahamensis TaxID=402147 RepID=A0A8J3D5T5_9BACT|nr:response regulator transcription factor [Persicitalea jodogahamensis]GHB79449.1 DNA-binding response regulator [Persicitalea jodogahamensis]
MIVSNESSFLTIVILDTHPINRMGLAVLIRQNSENVTVIEAQNVAQFQRDNQKVEPGLFISVLNDQSLIGNDQLAIEIKERFPFCFLIIYGEEQSPQHAIASLKSGVNGFFSKNADLVELSGCIERVMAGEMYLSPEYMQTLFAFLLLHHAVVKMQDILTPRQFEIAGYLVQGLSITAIAEKLGLHISTVSRFKANIFSKLGVDNILKLKEIFEQ